MSAVERDIIDVMGLAEDALAFALDACRLPDGTFPPVTDPVIQAHLAEYVSRWSNEYFMEMSRHSSSGPFMAKYIRGVYLLPVDQANVDLLTKRAAEITGIVPTSLADAVMQLFNSLLCTGVIAEVQHRASTLETRAQQEAAAIVKQGGRLN